MANAGNPPKRPKYKNPPPKADPPKSVLTKDPSGKPVPLNFTVENEFRREFKMYAVQNDMPMVDLLKLSFETYKQQSQI